MVVGTSVGHRELVHGDDAEDQRREEEEATCDSGSRPHAAPSAVVSLHRKYTPVGWFLLTSGDPANRTTTPVWRGTAVKSGASRSWGGTEFLPGGRRCTEWSACACPRAPSLSPAWNTVRLEPCRAIRREAARTSTPSSLLDPPVSARARQPHANQPHTSQPRETRAVAAAPSVPDKRCGALVIRGRHKQLIAHRTRNTPSRTDR